MRLVSVNIVHVHQYVKLMRMFLKILKIISQNMSMYAEFPEVLNNHLHRFLKMQYFDETISILNF